MLLWFRFGLPLGSAVLTSSFLDTIIGFFWLLLHYCSLEHLSQNQLPQNIEREYFENLQWSFFICLRALLAVLLWIGVVFMGKRQILLVWVVISIMDDLALLGNFVYHQLQYEKQFPVDIPWIANIVIFVVFRLYVTSIALQCLSKLGKKPEGDIVLPIENHDSIQPVGQGLFMVWDFYKDSPGRASSLLITAELMWNIFNLLTRELTKVQFGNTLFKMPGGNVNAYLILEETAVRCIRIVLDVLALIFIIKDKFTLMRIWICVYFLVLLSSIGIFLAVVRLWDIANFRILFFYSVYIVADNAFRFMILYFCVKFAITYRRIIIHDDSL